LPRATSLAAEIEEKFKVKSELEASSGGAFEVFVNGKKIFSKLETGRFPETEEILSKIK
jgi:selenoprotein W-related protein